MQLKHCSKCDGDLPLASFGKNRSRPDGLAYWCKACAGVANRRYYVNNKDVARAAVKRWNAANAERKAQKQREWYARNPTFDAAYKRQRRIDGTHNFAADVAKAARRRAKQAAASPTWGDKTMIRVIYDCAAAYTKATGVLHHVDHIVPLVSPIVCGLHVASNLQILSAIDNQRKSNRHWPDMPE